MQIQQMECEAITMVCLWLYVLCWRCFNYNSSLPFSQLEHCSPFTKQLCATWAHVPTPVTPLTGGSDVFLPIFIIRGSLCSMQRSNATAPERWCAVDNGNGWLFRRWDPALTKNSHKHPHPQSWQWRFCCFMPNGRWLYEYKGIRMGRKWKIWNRLAKSWQIFLYWSYNVQRQ